MYPPDRTLQRPAGQCGRAVEPDEGTWNLEVHARATGRRWALDRLRQLQLSGTRSLPTSTGWLPSFRTVHSLLLSLSFVKLGYLGTCVSNCCRAHRLTARMDWLDQIRLLLSTAERYSRRDGLLLLQSRSARSLIAQMASRPGPSHTKTGSSGIAPRDRSIGWVALGRRAMDGREWRGSITT